MATVRSIVTNLFKVGVYGLLLFGPALTVHWWRAWVLLACVYAEILVTRLWLLRDHEDVLNERRRPPIQAGQPVADRVLTVAFLCVFPAYLVFIPLDVFHFHLFPVPATLLSTLGLIAFLAGSSLLALALRDNAFAAGIVKHQSERRHRLVDTGPYRVVRHPFYAGIVCMLVGIALWLQSSAAVLFAVVPLTLLILRILVEEDFLRERLAGYDAYTTRVKYRLIPLVW